MFMVQLCYEVEDSSGSFEFGIIELATSLKVIGGNTASLNMPKHLIFLFLSWWFAFKALQNSDQASAARIVLGNQIWDSWASWGYFNSMTSPEVSAKDGTISGSSQMVFPTSSFVWWPSEAFITRATEGESNAWAGRYLLRSCSFSLLIQTASGSLTSRLIEEWHHTCAMNSSSNCHAKWTPDLCPEVEADEQGEIHTDEKNVWADEVFLFFWNGWELRFVVEKKSWKLKNPEGMQESHESHEYMNVY